MTNAAKPIPDGYHSLTPYLIVKNAGKAIEFYKKAFAAVELLRWPGPDGKIMHAQLRIGDSILMLADEFPGMHAKAPETAQGQFQYLYTQDADAVVKTAAAAGAKILQAVEDHFYGDRSGVVIDPFGHLWLVATHKEDLTGEQMKERQAKVKEA